MYKVYREVRTMSIQYRNENLKNILILAIPIIMENILQTDGELKGVFCHNDEMALGAVEAIAGAGKDILVVGFDATDDAVAAIKEGRMAATIAQQPALIGSTAVENAVNLINGEGFAKSIPVEVTLVTKDNAE